MSSREVQRLEDMAAALMAIREHLERGDLSDDLVYDAVRMRLIEIGEAVKALPAELLDQESGIAWDGAAGMRDWLTHHYFDTDHSIVRATVENNLPDLEQAVQRLLRLAEEG